MLRDEASTVHQHPGHTRDWREIDRTLRGLARKRAALDAEEAHWLCAAYRVQIWREVGCVSMADYMERYLGYGVRNAQERLRVALALEQLPRMTDAVASGDLPFTAVRALLRVATPDTEEQWLAHCGTMSVHQIEDAVSGRDKGDLPTDPEKPDLALRTLRYEDVRPSTAALEREALAKALVCSQCDQAWRESGGKRFALDGAELARARCDAQHIGALATDQPIRAMQDVPPRIRRLVWRRDRGRALDGCRPTANLEIHHIVPREDGGTHAPSNLTLACDGCHSAIHRGLIAVTGTAPDALVVTRKHAPHAPHRTHRTHRTRPCARRRAA